MPMQVDNCTLIFLEQVYRGELLVSTEDDFTPIPITDLLQYRTISASPLPIHLSTTILPIHQYLPIQCQSITNTSGQRIRIQGTRSLLGPTIGLDGGRFHSYPKNTNSKSNLYKFVDPSPIHHFNNPMSMCQSVTNPMSIQCQYN